MPSISEKSGIEGVFRALGAYIFSERPFFDKKYRFRHARCSRHPRVLERPHCAPKFLSECVFAGQIGWWCVSPILRSTSPGSQRIPGFFLCLQRFWAVCIETDIYRLVRLGALKVAPIRPHQFEVRLSCRNSLQGSRGTQCVKNIGRAPIPR